MATQAKVTRAFLQAGNYLPMAANEIAHTINTTCPEMWDSLTSKQLAMVINSLNTHWHKAKAHTEKEICAEGFIWDNSQKKLRDLT